MIQSERISANLQGLSAASITRGIAEGEFRATDVVRACLAHIHERDALIRAWESRDDQGALAGAAAVDRAASTGLLHGVPVGIKDVIDTAALPTQMGSSLYAGYRPRYDAACVAALAAAGAIVLGKTVTAEFAGAAPTRTRNPRNPAHTPGGSSSGSAAAVADGMVPIALGTQTGGSVLRPAAFTGVIGFKPTYGSYSTAGVKAAAASLDTLGVIARTIEDVARVHAVLARVPLPATATLDAVPRIGYCRTHLWPTVSPDTEAALANAVEKLASAGATVRPCTRLDQATALTEARAVINAYERAHALVAEWETDRERLSAQTRRVCTEGFTLTRERYLDALDTARRYRRELRAVFDDFDILLTPVAPGIAPKGLDYAGDPRLQELWTLLHVPSIALPTHGGEFGLPIGIQLIAPWHADIRLLTVSHWVIRTLHPS